jgi:hypothetical protein
LPIFGQEKRQQSLGRCLRWCYGVFKVN